MLYRHKQFEETLVHQCADANKYIKSRRQEMANVRVHDISAYLVVQIKEGYTNAVGTVPIKYCPFCGVELEKDEQTGEYLDLELLG